MSTLTGSTTTNTMPRHEASAQSHPLTISNSSRGRQCYYPHLKINLKHREANSRKEAQQEPHAR